MWLDEYAQYYYQRIGNEKGDYGDVSDRLKLRFVLFIELKFARCSHTMSKIYYFPYINCREKLGCKSFKWYLDNIYPELFIPGEAVASGEVKSSVFELRFIYFLHHNLQQELEVFEFPSIRSKNKMFPNQLYFQSYRSEI